MVELAYKPRPVPARFLFVRDNDIAKLKRELNDRKKVFDKDGPFSINTGALWFADKLAFEKFKEPYPISPRDRGWLETRPGFSASERPYEVILALNERSKREGYTEGFFKGLKTTDPLKELEKLISELPDKSIELAKAIHALRVNETYRHPQAIEHMVESPGAVNSFMEVLAREIRNNGRKGTPHIVFVTSTETQELARLHFEATFRSAGIPKEQRKMFYDHVGIITAQDVTHTKPHPEPIKKGIEMLGGGPCISIGDTNGDREATARAREEGEDVLFFAITSRRDSRHFAKQQFRDHTIGGANSIAVLARS